MDSATVQPTATDAAWEYLARQDRRHHPDGKTDKGGRWYPAPHEERPCCASIRSPSRAYPWSYMLHCRTLAHVAELFHLDAKDVRREVTRLRKEGIV